MRQGQLLVTDGPFAETKEWIGGFDLLECGDIAEAVAIASRHPMARFGRIEVRPVWSPTGPSRRENDTESGLKETHVNPSRIQ